MSSKTKRREPRIDISLPVTLHLPDGQLNYEISNASYRGIFIACPEPLQLRKLVRFETRLDDQPEPLQMLGLVAHTVNAAEARESGGTSGMGIQLFSVGKETMQRWRGYIKERYEQDPAVREEMRAMPQPHISVHMRSMDQLSTFATRDLEQGSIFVRTSDLRPADSTVVCDIFHPRDNHSPDKEPFSLRARVVDVTETPRRERGMRLEFLELGEKERRRFAAFVQE